jgi:hypothetical protein
MTSGALNLVFLSDLLVLVKEEGEGRKEGGAERPETRSSPSCHSVSNWAKKRSFKGKSVAFA